MTPPINSGRPFGAAVKYIVPDDLEFADLRLRRESSGSIQFDWRVVQRVCDQSGLSVRALAFGPREDLIAFLVGWYKAQLSIGGPVNAVAEALDAELQVWPLGEDPLALPPGHA